MEKIKKQKEGEKKGKEREKEKEGKNDVADSDVVFSHPSVVK